MKPCRSMSTECAHHKGAKDCPDDGCENSPPGYAFTPANFALTAQLLRSTEEIRRVAASNYHNVILAALDRCSVTVATTEYDVQREMLDAAKELLRHDGGKGSEGYHAFKSYDARARLQAAIVKAESGS